MINVYNVVTTPDSYSIFPALTFQRRTDKNGKQVMRLHCIIYGIRCKNFVYVVRYPKHTRP